MAHKEPIATNADTMWRLGMMGLLGTFVPNRNIDRKAGIRLWVLI
jgi:hypothetical protein